MGESQLGISIEVLKKELNDLQKEQTSGRDWDPKTQGKRLLELQNLLNPKSPPLSPELGKRQAVAGTVEAGVRQPELSAQEKSAIAAANVRSPKSTK